MALLTGSTAVIALYKLAVYVKILGPALTVPQLALVVLFVGSLFRCIYVSVDPIYMGYTDMLGRQAHMLVTIHLPIFCITTMLLGTCSFQRTCFRDGSLNLKSQLCTGRR
jgi:hypothetical protein